ncbi:hypothetical protein [Microbacterium aurugineum]|uniref:hypothetical protein n=1 Tax=Microbacterium aurugineum TaxID=2851642 RepID=UPI0020BF9A90|nr:hypothetical protein [Microbacterium aurugineum]MCK8476915.1 hypothetical protein [Microbacterium aurugineum]
MDQQQASEALAVGDAFRFENLSDPAAGVWELLPEVQIAVNAASKSASSAISMAYTMNALRKASAGRDARGRFTAEAQDCLRSALLFSGAGLDTALKRLVAHTLPILVNNELAVAKQFEDYSKRRIANGSDGVDPRELLQLLLSTAKTPRDVLLERWVYDLRSSSAQSAERVMELATACGVSNRALKKRFTPSKDKSSLIERAFSARNQIAHELDVTNPAEGARKALETIRQYRKAEDITSMCQELLDVTQDIVNDVAARLVIVEK